MLNSITSENVSGTSGYELFWLLWIIQSHRNKIFYASNSPWTLSYTLSTHGPLASPLIRWYHINIQAHVCTWMCYVYIQYNTCVYYIVYICVCILCLHMCLCVCGCACVCVHVCGCAHSHMQRQASIIPKSGHNPVIHSPRICRQVSRDHISHSRSPTYCVPLGTSPNTF